ncbi:hypothetical protein BDP27DRAFT_1406702 [Rhodocollybia butyracea]|uniref:F-box domain-containing protein n=1 Tax=Rhodocollybia butyracea TaxID=206335 RepID=A0A9P5PAL1_9AGAR|nr:hypothetical protein BDP27DRAFT_1406702 [Rhodocollybia butyracea]
MDTPTTSTIPGILGLSTLDARNQHLLALDPPKHYTCLPCGLPAELWNIIMDYLHDDKDALMSCLRACRGWGDFCRYHVYDTFIWSVIDEFDDTQCMFHPCPRYVRHLALNGGFLDELADGYDVEWLMPLARHLDEFVSVVHLEVESVDWDDVFETKAWNTFCAASGFLSQIKSLDLSNIPLQPFQNILDSICLFPALEKLDYLPSHVDIDDEDLDLQLCAPSRSWRVFSTEHAPLQLPTSGFWTWLSAVTFTSLQTIRLDSVPTSDLSSLTSYLHLLGASLRNFRVRFVTPHDIHDFAQSGALVKSTGLQRLELVGFIRQYHDNTIWVGEESLTFLTTIPGGSLYCLDIIMDNTSRRVAESSPSHSSALDGLLTSSDRFTALKRVHLTAALEYSDEARKSFPRCQRAGLLTMSAKKPNEFLATLESHNQCTEDN